MKIKIYRAVVLPFVLYGCDTWSVTLREEHRLRGFKNTVLRKIFGSKRDEVAREWRRLRNEVLRSALLIKYYSGDEIKKNKTGRARGTCGGKERCVQGFCRKT